MRTDWKILWLSFFAVLPLVLDQPGYSQAEANQPSANQAPVNQSGASSKSIKINQNLAPPIRLRPAISPIQNPHPALVPPAVVTIEQGSQAPSSRPPVTLLQPHTAISSPVSAVVSKPANATAVKTSTKPNTTASKYISYPLVDQKSQPFRPAAFLPVGDNLCFLGVNCVWLSKTPLNGRSANQPIVAERFNINTGDTIDNVPVQEFNNFVYFAPDDSLMILDKAGDLFEFSLDTHKFKVFRANAPFLQGAPDPDFIDLAVINNQVIVLDPERNDLWRIDSKTKKVEGLFKAVLPWRIKPGDVYVGDGICIAYDGALYMLKNAGLITKYTNVEQGRNARQMATPCKRLLGCRPSRLATTYGAPLFVVERENNRVIAYDKNNGKTKQYLFPRHSDLRSIYPAVDAFYIVDNDSLLYRQ